MIEIVVANTEKRIAQAKALFQEYAESLGFDLCFQNFDVEMDRFPDQYSAPTGGLFLALSQNQPIGCVGVRYFDKDICEMKRLYVYDRFNGMKIGKALCEKLIVEANANMGVDYIKFRVDDNLGAVEKMRPEVFVMENVKGILSAKINGKVLGNRHKIG